jgi:Fe2+ or Zn2+ uptake regulation protein
MDFLKILKELTAATSLELSDICVMAVLVTYAQYEPEQSVEMSYSEIHAEFTRLSITTIKRAIKRLEDNHYIQIKRSGTQKNRYKVLIDIPKVQTAPQIKQKKIANKLDSDAEYIAQATQAMRKNPFMQ